MAPPRWIADVVQRLTEGWSPTLCVSTLAEEAGVHPVYLARCVRRWYGVSLGTLLRHERLRRAAERVLTTRERLAVIAYATGFSDEAHCSRTLHHSLGAAPSVLRRRLTALPAPMVHGAMAHGRREVARMQVRRAVS